MKKILLRQKVKQHERFVDLLTDNRILAIREYLELPGIEKLHDEDEVSYTDFLTFIKRKKDASLEKLFPINPTLVRVKKDSIDELVFQFAQKPAQNVAEAQKENKEDAKPYEEYTLTYLPPPFQPGAHAFKVKDNKLIFWPTLPSAERESNAKDYNMAIDPACHQPEIIGSIREQLGFPERISGCAVLPDQSVLAISYSYFKKNDQGGRTKKPLKFDFPLETLAHQPLLLLEPVHDQPYKLKQVFNCCDFPNSVAVLANGNILTANATDLLTQWTLSLTDGENIIRWVAEFLAKHANMPRGCVDLIARSIYLMPTILELEQQAQKKPMHALMFTHNNLNPTGPTGPAVGLTNGF